MLLDGYDFANALPQHEVWINYALSANERGEEVLRNVRAVLPSLRGKRHLDIGCAYGGACVAAARAGAVSVGVDVDESLLRFAEANRKDHPDLPLEFRRSSAMDASLADALGRFDVVTCDNVIEHVDSPERLIANISSLLASEGLAYVTIPNAFSLGQIRKDCHYGQFGISLLDSYDGAIFMKEIWGKPVYDVSAYYRFDAYASLFARFGLSIRLLNASDGANWEQIWNEVQKLPQEFEAANVPESLRPKVRRALGEHVVRVKTDVDAMQSSAGERRQALQRLIGRDYETEVWCVVASRAESPRTDLRDEGLRSALVGLGEQANSVARTLVSRGVPLGLRALGSVGRRLHSASGWIQSSRRRSSHPEQPRRGSDEGVPQVEDRGEPCRHEPRESVKTLVDPETGNTLVVDPDIPGQIGWDDLIAMARVAKLVPPGGVIVETGSLFGRSAFVWSMNSDPSVRVFCIDPWVREQWIIELVEARQQPVMPFSVEAFRHYTRECKNVTAIQGFSPAVVQESWSTPVDLYFDDSDHSEPGLSRNWDFWLEWVKPGGIVCGDDYYSGSPDVIAKANALAKLWRAPLNRRDLFWWLRKPD
jgi:2-polyprenyl-3-methyl-5-hydroxy-6-metoxy-1,4-benzoquinol methylase